MTAENNNLEDLPVVSRVEDFDRKSGGILERFLFRYRLPFVVLCVIFTIFLGWRALGLTVNASFDKMIPQSNPYIQNYFNNRAHLSGLGNVLRIVVQNKKGTIFNKHYLKVLQEINDKVYIVPGVDRAWMKSLWTPNVRWVKITARGTEGGPVMPPSYDGSRKSINTLRGNVRTAGIIGAIVGADLKSSAISIPLLNKNPYTNEPLNYEKLFKEFQGIRHKYQSDNIQIRIVGFAELSGVLISYLNQIVYFFFATLLLVGIILFFYTRCIRSTLLVISVGLISVIWLLGLMQIMGLVIDPYSALVPFLVFAIGSSHGSQKMNGVMQDIARGSHRYVAARYTFRRLFRPGVTAILCNIVGFLVLLVIDVPAIKELAIMTSLGVAILIFAVLMMVPVALSLVGVSPKAAARRLRIEERDSQPGGTPVVQRVLLKFTEQRWAIVAIAVAVALGGGSYVVSRHLHVGDVGAGAPELWPDSQYNQDIHYINAHYSRSSDKFAVIVKTPAGGCRKFQTLIGMDRLDQKLLSLPNVLSVSSLASTVRYMTSAMYDGTPKWITINRGQPVLNQAVQYARNNNPALVDVGCSVAPIVAYLSNHNAPGLRSVMHTVVNFKQLHDTKTLHFLPAAGSAGIQAITNIVVKKSNLRMLLLLYSATALLCLLGFRSVRAAIVAIIPLVITSIICEALMVELNIGLKVSTLPVIALGVGAGIDYAVYLLSIELNALRSGATLREAYGRALGFTGKVVLLVGLMLAAGVITWAWSPIKFQADMGILLTFMFLWNMIGSVILIPALSRFLLRGVGGSSRQTSQASLSENV